MKGGKAWYALQILIRQDDVANASGPRALDDGITVLVKLIAINVTVRINHLL